MGLREDRALRLVGRRLAVRFSTSRRPRSRPRSHTPAGDESIEGRRPDPGRRDDLPGRAPVARAHALRVDRSLASPTRPTPTRATSSSTSTTRSARTSRRIRPTSLRASASAAGADAARTAWVKEQLETLKKRNGDELERGFVTYRTLCDVRFMDPAIDPNDRKPRWCFSVSRRPPIPARWASAASRPCGPGCRSGRSTTRTPTAPKCAALGHRAAARDRELGR